MRIVLVMLLFFMSYWGWIAVGIAGINNVYPDKWYVVIPSYLWAGWVAYSRMYLGVHYPSDILGGAIVGGGSAFLMYKINNWMARKNGHKPLTAFIY